MTLKKCLSKVLFVHFITITIIISFHNISESITTSNVFYSYKNSYALIIVNQKYPYLGSIERNIKVYERSNKIMKCLKKCGFKENEIERVKNVDKTEFNIYYRKFIKKAQNNKNNRLLFIYIGKSHTSKRTTYLIMNDSTQANFEKNININEFIKNTEGIQDNHIFFLFDCCIRMPKKINTIDRPILTLEKGFQDPIIQLLSLCSPNDKVPADFTLIDNLTSFLCLKNESTYITAGKVVSELKFAIDYHSPNINYQYGTICQNKKCKGNFIFELNPEKRFPGNSQSKLTIHTKPSDAKIFIVWFNKKSSKHFKPKYKHGIVLKPGEYKVKVLKKNYQTYFDWIKITKGEHLIKRIELKPLGELFVDIAPGDSKVAILNILPKYKPGIKLPEGKYIIQAQKKGFITQIEKVKILPGEKTKININLKPCPKGKLFIDTIPKDANIRITNIMPKYKEGMELDIKKYTIKVFKDGYITYKKQIILKPGNNKYKVKLKPLAKLFVKTKPEDAIVRITNIKPKYRNGIPLKPGQYTLEVKKRGYKTVKEKINVKKGKNEHVIALEQIQNKKYTKMTKIQTYTESVTNMKFILVRGGTFNMGCKKGSKHCDDNDIYAAKININDFWIGVHEVTNRQFNKFIKQTDYDFNINSKDLDYPVVHVNWALANKYAKWLSKITSSKLKFSLPDEKEWEYACRNLGKNQLFSGCGKTSNFAWYKKNSMGKLHRVALKKPNSIGLYDMSGNVWEWCINSDGKNKKIIRGGSWDTNEKSLRCTNRSSISDKYKLPSLGFRLVGK